MTERIRRLKEKLDALDDRAVWLERTALCREGYERYQWEPPLRQTAHLFAHVLENMAVVIDEDDLLVGRTQEVVPNAEQENYLAENARFSSTLGQWTLDERHREAAARAFSPRDVEVMSIYGTAPGGWRNGHTTPSWPRVVHRGFDWIKEEAAQRLAQVAGRTPEEIEQMHFLEAVILCADAINTLARRYAAEAGRLAEAALDERARAHWRQMQAVCEWVPAQPARTFWEGVQAVWFVQFALSVVIGSRDFAPGRFDQYLWPLYAHDMAEGRLNWHQAQELVDCFYLKLNENIGRGNKRSLCVNSVQYLILGGQTPEGQDACNDLSFLCLDAIEHLRLKQPTVIVRYHRNVNPAFFRQACAMIRLGTGHPALFNDETMIPALLNVGIPMEDARDYAVVGCANPNIPGREPALNDHRLNVPKCLELALNNGVCQRTGRDTGVHTGRAEDFATFEDFLAAFYRHVDELVAWWVRRNDFFDCVTATCVCDPFLSSLVEGCLENARDGYAGGSIYFHNPYQAAGLATAADALAALKTLVFEQRELTLAGFRELLRRDFEGAEDFRQRLRERGPRFGNDDALVDGLARQVAQYFCRAVLRHPTRWGNGRGNWPGLYSFGSNHIHYGRQTAATPDGRKAGDPISFNLSPAEGCDRSGPTAALKSVAQLDFSLVSGGGTFDLKLHPASLRDPGKLESLLRTYLDLGGMQIQLNVVDAETLRAAQQTPGAYRDLLVRITGFSAYFVELDPATQEEIIGRYEYAV